MAEEKFQACECPIVITWSACCITYSCLGRKHALNILYIPALCILYTSAFSSLSFLQSKPSYGYSVESPCIPFFFLCESGSATFLPGLTEITFPSRIRNSVPRSDLFCSIICTVYSILLKNSQIMKFIVPYT